MNNIFKISKLFLIALFLFVFAVPYNAYAHRAGQYSTVIDESGNIVYITAWSMQKGDQVLTEDNKRYEIIAVEGGIAKSKFIGEVNLAHYVPKDNEPRIFANFFKTSVASAKEQGKVAIYHTHSDESYVPTDKEESIRGAGGIYKVGQSFKEALEKNGLKVFFAETKHDPHDDMAYERSRRTAMSLIKNDKPDAIFDIHRDAVPPEVYRGKVNGEDIAKLQLVVGKHGPTGKQIEEYALQIKAAADKTYPGLVKGIFFAKGGDYNQDLHPRSMLIEAGAHTNERLAAERGIAMFADVVPAVLGVNAQNAAANDAGMAKKSEGGAAAAGNNQRGEGGFIGSFVNTDGVSGAVKSIILIIGLLILGTALFLYLSTGSLKEAKSKLKQFVTTEFTNFLGPREKIKEDKKLSKIKKESDD